MFWTINIILFRTGSGPEPQPSLEVLLFVEKLCCVRLRIETCPVDHHSSLLKSSWTRISIQIALHIISLQKDLISASEIILFLHQPSHLFLHTRFHTSEDSIGTAWRCSGHHSQVGWWFVFDCGLCRQPTVSGIKKYTVSGLYPCQDAFRSVLEMRLVCRCRQWSRVWNQEISRADLGRLASEADKALMPLDACFGSNTEDVNHTWTEKRGHKCGDDKKYSKKLFFACVNMSQCGDKCNQRALWRPVIYWDTKF